MSDKTKHTNPLMNLVYDLPNTIWKFQAKPVDTQEIMMPGGARIIHAATQKDIITIWAEVNKENALAKRRIVVIGTGNPADLKYKTYIGTVFQGPFVWHLYDCGEVA